MSAAARVFGEAEFILGREVECFEGEFARYCGCAYGVGVDSGTSALELALRAFGVGPGDEVIVPANTFIATALAVSSTGATPVLVDVDPLTYTIDVAGSKMRSRIEREPSFPSISMASRPTWIPFWRSPAGGSWW